MDPIRRFCLELELTRPFTEAELKIAYRRKMSEYHPDKVSMLGKELRELAEEKSKAINIAYDRLQPYADK